jgi:hypothetical protein
MLGTIHYQRYMPTWVLPPYAFLPGHNTHPNKPGGHMYGKEEPEAEQIDLENPNSNNIFRYSLDLYNLDFYWEGHVYLEALWNAHDRKGHIADFSKGFIKLAAAGIKFKLGQQAAGIGHLKRGIELFKSIKVSNDKNFLGFNLQEISHQTELEISRMKNNQIKRMNLPIHPNWN